ncbi:hypothetical protein JCM3766R1_000426 [Sporobolomyces carnicolor]
MSKRSRDPRDDPKSGPSKHQLRGLSYVGQKPAFLQNALTALAGGSAKAHNPRLDANGRPAIPTRPEDGPGGSDGDDDGDEQDEWDLGGGDEAPTVVVLKEGKHLDRDEVDRLRAQGTTIEESTEPESGTKSKGSLSFSSGTGSKSKKDSSGPKESWDDVVKRSKGHADAKQADKEQKAVDAAKEKDKDDKRKKKEKKEAKKKIGMLSFGDDE